MCIHCQKFVKEIKKALINIDYVRILEDSQSITFCLNTRGRPYTDFFNATCYTPKSIKVFFISNT